MPPSAFPVIRPGAPPPASRGVRLARGGATVCALAFGGALTPPLALAHEYWIVPSTYRAAAGDTLAIAAFVGTGFRGERKPYAPTRAMRFTVHGAKMRDLRPVGVNGELTWARFITDDGGGCVVAYESGFVPIELEAPEFDAYLALEGLDRPLQARTKLGALAGKGRERYARCPKTWIAGSAAVDPLRALQPVGLPIEVVPLDDPTTAHPVRFRILYKGKPLAKALVRAWNQPLESGAIPRDAMVRDSVGPLASARTDGHGVAALALDQPGEWMVTSVHMVPCPDREMADWESRWASLTFVRPARTQAPASRAR